jgi:predicted transposase YbfD/YdcC
VRSHRWGLTLGQQAVADKTNAIPVLADVWRGRVVEGRVITVDAWLIPRALADRIVHRDGDYVMRVQGNQPQLQHDTPVVFHEAHMLAAAMTATETVDSGHGRSSRAG